VDKPWRSTKTWANEIKMDWRGWGGRKETWLRNWKGGCPGYRSLATLAWEGQGSNRAVQPWWWWRRFLSTGTTNINNGGKNTVRITQRQPTKQIRESSQTPKRCAHYTPQYNGAEIPDARSKWRPMYVVPHYGICITSPSRRIECLGGSYILRKFVHPASMGNVHHKVVRLWLNIFSLDKLLVAGLYKQFPAA